MMREENIASEAIAAWVDAHQQCCNGCDHCGKRSWTHGEHCCSDECYSEWCPF